MKDKLLNKRWRINHLYKVVNKNKETVRFVENDIQQHINDSKSKRKMILKARQFGVSTNAIINLLDDCIFHRNRTNVILAHEQDGIEKLFRIARFAYKNLDPRIQPVLDRGGGSKYEMFFPSINSRIYCDLESRGDTISKLHVSELAFMKDMSRLKATTEAVPMDGEVTFESTPNGMNEFYDYWNDPNFKYDKLFFPWYFFNEYRIHYDGPIFYTDEENGLIIKAKTLYAVDLDKHQINYRRWKKSELQALFTQEYPEDDQSCFLASGNSAMDLNKVAELLRACQGPLKEVSGIKIFEDHDKTCTYVIGADTAEGVGSDYSVAIVYNATKRRTAAVIRCQMKPYDFAHKLFELGKLYSIGGRPRPLLAVERNNHGHAVLLELEQNLKYGNLFRTENGRTGWLTDKVTRPIMVDTFIEGVENETIQIKDEETLRECLTLIDNNGKIEAEKNKHDDCIIANSIALQMCLRVSQMEVYKNIGSKILL